MLRNLRSADHDAAVQPFFFDHVFPFCLTTRGVSRQGHKVGYLPGRVIGSSHGAVVANVAVVVDIAVVIFRSCVDIIVA